MDNKKLFTDGIKPLFNKNERSDAPIEFAKEEKISEPEKDYWKILIVDDEKDIHTITEIALNNYQYINKKIKILNAYSAKEAIEIMKHHQDIAIVLLDVVMETTDAGLKMVKIIREEIHRLFVRIILRTGQPGYAPQAEVITKYDINDYQTKTELSHERLLTVITAGLRAYDSIMAIENFRLDLDRKVEERTNELLKANQLLSAKNKQIELQREELEKLNASKDKLFSIIAHDLKGPFTPILGFSELLLNNMHSYSSDEIYELIKDIHKSGQNAFQLLENLLEWAMAQIDKTTFNPRKLTLKTIVNDIIYVTTCNSQPKDIQVRNDIDDSIYIFADRNMLNTMLRNLLSNAIKYTHPNGYVRIFATHTSFGTLVSVSDNGVGIDAVTLKNLFDITKKTSKPGTANERGTGLGLILCKEFIEKHAGKIWVESELGKGCTFHFLLPIASNEQETLT